MISDASENPKLLLSPDEFRAGLHYAIGRNAIYDYLDADKIRHFRVGRKILIPASELLDFPKRESGV